ncbi:conserved hypothetical protein [Hymenobacter roseosalivarius DSM 11622]|uniref:DUF1440 domain-containing protein n=1 Tax=Hymenobacter roseosalivarius DSM 11622 TaxID=645990 RepID=A0A1W1W269_9BACT|nr:hypothetical protein [Hymenobacter roseosalivarius]SMB99707.1 conserved hypothetical protein [Hymenobacter roseosalivarius DSM 11622]
MVLYAGLLVGTFDILAAFTSFFISTENNPLLILKAIASGVLGRAAFSGAGGTMLLGLSLHFFIALTFTALFFRLYRRVGFISRNKVAAGVLYGLLIWAVMNLLVLPLSQVPVRPFQPFHALREALILVFMIGVPLAFLAGRPFDLKS